MSDETPIIRETDLLKPLETLLLEELQASFNPVSFFSSQGRTSSFLVGRRFQLLVSDKAKSVGLLPKRSYAVSRLKLSTLGHKYGAFPSQTLGTPIEDIARLAVAIRRSRTFNPNTVYLTRMFGVEDSEDSALVGEYHFLDDSGSDGVQCAIGIKTTGPRGFYWPEGVRIVCQGTAAIEGMVEAP